MEPTWQFYAAIGLAVVAALIILLLVFLLVSPQKNKFDRGSHKRRKPAKK